MANRRVIHIADRRPPESRVRVNLSAISCRGGPYGRSRVFKLREEDVEELLRHAEALERRATP